MSLLPMSSGPVSSGVAKADTTWSVVIDTTTNSTTFPDGIRNGDAVFSYIFQAMQIPGQNTSFFNQPFGTKLAGYQAISYFPQTNMYTHLKAQVTFIAGTNSLSGTPVGSGGTTLTLCRYTVFRRSPDYFEDPTLSFLGTEVTGGNYPSQSVAYTGSPSVILGMAAVSTATNNVQTVTIGGVTPTVITKNSDTANFTRLWYRANITPSTMTTVGTTTTSPIANRCVWRPFVVH